MTPEPRLCRSHALLLRLHARLALVQLHVWPGHRVAKWPHLLQRTLEFEVILTNDLRIGVPAVRPILDHSTAPARERYSSRDLWKHGRQGSRLRPQSYTNQTPPARPGDNS